MKNETKLAGTDSRSLHPNFIYLRYLRCYTFEGWTFWPPGHVIKVLLL